MRKARTEAARRFYIALGQQISEARQRQHLTQEALASCVSLTRTSIVNIERGKQQVLLHTLVQIALALKMNPGDLIPDAELNGEPVLQVISKMVTDSQGREWMEKSLSEQNREVN